jgi:hypothetical protein
MTESSGGGEFKDDVLDALKSLCKCHNVPPSSTTIKINYNILIII